METYSPHAKDSQVRIRRAQSEEDVVRAVHDYVRALEAQALARLPQPCRPENLRDRDDIVAFNVELARKELVFEGPGEDAMLLREMLSVMTEAASRFAQLSARQLPPATR